MESTKINVQDRKDMEKFTKFLAYKSAQIIVQSRLGEKVKTKSKPHNSGTDWFNLAINDYPEIASETKKAMCGELPSVHCPLCVEISLKTVEGDSMVLETWCLSVLEQSDNNIRVTYTVYNRIGILLKSLISVTRVTPAYKLSRRQSSDSYIICYRIYLAQPQLQCLGEGYQQVRVGQLSTPMNTFHLSVCYRTKLTISPQHTCRDNPLMLKSDHFHPDLSPRHTRPSHRSSDVDRKGGKQEANKAGVEVNGFHHEDDVCLKDTVKIGAFADAHNKPPQLDNNVIIPEFPFTSLLAPQPSKRCVENGERVTENGNHHELQNEGETEINNHRNNPSDADSRRSSPFANVVDDFIMVDVKTPFAGPTTTNDLGVFLRECQSAPPLATFQDQPSLEEQVHDLSDQLQLFEMNMKEYDDLLRSLCQSDAQ